MMIKTKKKKGGGGDSAQLSQSVMEIKYQCSSVLAMFNQNILN